MVAPVGVTGSFAEAATKTLPELCGLHLGESTVERVFAGACDADPAGLPADRPDAAAVPVNLARDVGGERPGTTPCYVTSHAGSAAEGRWDDDLWQVLQAIPALEVR